MEGVTVGDDARSNLEYKGEGAEGMQVFMKGVVSRIVA